MAAGHLTPLAVQRAVPQVASTAARQRHPLRHPEDDRTRPRARLTAGLVNNRALGGRLWQVLLPGAFKARIGCSVLFVDLFVVLFVYFPGWSEGTSEGPRSRLAAQPRIGAE